MMPPTTTGTSPMPDALGDDLEAGVARAYRDLLGAVGMAVEARFSNQHLEAAAETARDLVDALPHRLERLLIAERRGGAADAGGRAPIAERFSQRVAPFAGGDARMRGGDRGLHDVAALLGG